MTDWAVVQRITRLIQIEREAQEDGDTGSLGLAKEKRLCLMAGLQNNLDRLYGGPVRCPLCHPALLEDLPLRDPKLRNCVKHDLKTLLIHANAKHDMPSATSTSLISGQRLMPETRATTQSGIFGMPANRSSFKSTSSWRAMNRRKRNDERYSGESNKTGEAQEARGHARRAGRVGRRSGDSVP